MGGDNTDTSKRKRSTAGRSEKVPPAKKPAKAKSRSSDEAGPNTQSRKVINIVYKRYCLLSNPESAGQENAFQALLDSCEGDLAARRLASRLIPRFAARFPEKLDTAARSLMDLSTQDPTHLQNYKPSVAEATRLEALRGLGDLCVAATAQSPDSRTASSIILHFLRRIQQLKGKKRRGRDPLRGFATENGSHSGTSSGSTRDEQEAIASSLATALQGSPKAVLAACLESLGYGSGELYEAAKNILAAFLKPPAKGPGDELSNGVTQEEGAANMVRQALEPAAKVAEWLRETVQATLGRRSPVPAATKQLLEKILASIPQPAAVSPSAKPSRSKKSASPPKPNASAKASPSKSSRATAADAKPSTKQAPSSKEPKRDEKAPAAAKAAESSKGDSVERVPAGRLKKSALPDHMVPNGGTPSRVESGELMEEGPSRGGSVKPMLANGAAENTRPREGRTSSSERHSGRGGSADRALDTLPVPGGSVCAAVSCLWLAGLGPQATQTQIMEVCRRSAPVDRVLQLPPPMSDQALVFFSDLSHAAVCYEALEGTMQFGRSPLEVQFCEVPPGTPLRPGERERVHVWVGGVQTKTGEEEVVRIIMEAGIQKPTNVLPVGGDKPGLVLQFSSTKPVSAAVKALRAGLGPLAPPPGRRDRSRSPLRGRSPVGGSPFRLPSLPLPDFASCTLWVGQVGPDVSDDQLIRAFSRIGPLKGWKVLRKSNCAFIDYERMADAATARTVLHDQPFGTWNLRVEWKEEGMAMGRGPRSLMRGMPRRGGRGGGRRGSLFRDGPRDSLRNSPLRYRDGRVDELSPSRIRGSPSYGPAWTPTRSLTPDRSLRRSPRRSPRGRASPATRKFKWDLHPANPGFAVAKDPSRSQSPMRRSKSPARDSTRGRASRKASPDAERVPRRSSKKEPESARKDGKKAEDKKVEPQEAEEGKSEPRQGPQKKETKTVEANKAGDAAPAKRIRKWDVQGPCALVLAPQPEGVEPRQEPPGDGQPAASASQEPASKKARHEPDAASLPAPSATPPPLPLSTPPPLPLDITSPAPPPQAQPPPQPSTALLSPQPSVAAACSASSQAPGLPKGRVNEAEAVSTSGTAQLAVEAWTGKLAKSGSVVCSVQCKGVLRQDMSGAAGLEPVGWPPILDVTLRIETNLALQQFSAAADKGALLRLVLAGDPGSLARFKDFCAYLTSRNRAGVVQNVPPAQGLPKRTLYLIPPTLAVTERLQVVWDQQEPMLVALIVPAASK